MCIRDRAISSLVILPLSTDEVYPTSVVVSILITPGSPVVLVIGMIPVAVVIMVIGVTVGALFGSISSVIIIWSVIIIRAVSIIVLIS